MLTINPELDRYAICYNRDANTSFWQHLSTGQMFSLTESCDKLSLMILDRRTGRWTDNGVQTLNQILRLYANAN